MLADHTSIKDKPLPRNRIRKSSGERLFVFLVYFFVIAFALLCFLPFLLVIIVSLTEEKEVITNGYSFFPKHWSGATYRLLFSSGSSVPHAYRVTAQATLIGTALAVLITYGAAYTLASRDCKYRNGLALYFYFTMVFTTGLVPWYMVSKMIGAYDNLLALIIPSLLFSPFNMFLLRNFIRAIPHELNESAKLDGAGDLTIAFRIYFPLSLPSLATITLFYAIGYWNNYFNAVMLINNKKFYTLQMLLFRIQSEITAMQKIIQGAQRSNPPKESFKMATCVVTMGPIILFYPFVQRYFVKGIVVGAVKG